MRKLDRSRIIVGLLQVILGIAIIYAAAFIWLNPQWGMEVNWHYLIGLGVLVVCIRAFFNKRIRNYWEGRPQDNDRWWSDGIRTMREHKWGTVVVAFYLLSTAFNLTVQLVLRSS